MYLWERRDWPHFRWDDGRLAGPLAEARLKQGRLLGRLEAMGFLLRQQALLSTLTEEVLKTSEIEGETLNKAQVRSSIARRLGIDAGGLVRAERDVDGIVEMMLDATGKYDRPLTKERICGWHAALFPTGRSGMRRIRAGEFRDDAEGPMQVVSGPVGRERVHYEAPPATRLDAEAGAFLDWFELPSETDLVLRAGIAHLWFATLHPFEDGNGRIARAVADMMLARSEKGPERFYSMSAQIRREREDYYALLQRTDRGTMDITPWLEWFLGCLSRAIEGSHETLGAVLRKARFWERHAGEVFNERQTRVLNRLLDDFEGNLTSSKWARLARCSQDTAHRDIVELIARGILVKNPAGGRSTSYSLAEG